MTNYHHKLNASFSRVGHCDDAQGEDDGPGFGSDKVSKERSCHAEMEWDGMRKRDSAKRTSRITNGGVFGSHGNTLR